MKIGIIIDTKAAIRVIITTVAFMGIALKYFIAKS
jgi:hypothetical protein